MPGAAMRMEPVSYHQSGELIILCAECGKRVRQTPDTHVYGDLDGKPFAFFCEPCSVAIVARQA